MSSVMKTIALLSAIFTLPAASLLAQGQSDFDALRSRIDSAERRINLLEREVARLKGSSVSEVSSHSEHTNTYVVVKGDYLSKVAKRYGTTVVALKKANGLTKNDLSVGQKLIIPNQSKAVAKSAPKAKVAKKSVVSASKAKHKVVRGETFYSIARDYNVRTSDLVAANPSIKPTNLRIGQTLNIQKSKAVSSRKATAPKPKAKASVAKKSTAPKPSQKLASSTPAKNTVTKKSEPAIRTITVNQQMTYGQFASKYGASTTQLNELNGLSLNKSTKLAKGSELYVPQY